MLILRAWMREALGEGETPLSPFVLERAHRVRPKRDITSCPRPLITHFPNYKDKQAVLQAAQDRKDIHYNNQQVRFSSDLAMGLLQQRREFDSIWEKLRKKNIRHGVAYPAKRLVAYGGKTHVFKTPVEASMFLKNGQAKKSNNME